MLLILTNPRHLRSLAALACFVASMVAHLAASQSIHAAATLRERPAMPVAARFQTRATPPAAGAGSGLGGTSWQLVKFTGGDGTTLVPDDKTKYTVAFGADGRVTLRLDCNRGSGNWTSSSAPQLQFGPLALTRAACPQPALSDRLVKDWPAVRSYVMRGGHLFLSLMSDAGIYEFEPAATAARP